MRRAVDYAATVVVDQSWKIAVDELVSRPVRAARMVMAIHGFDRDAVIVLDADSDEFVVVAGLPTYVRPETVSLSSDGSHLVFLARQDDDTLPMRVVLHRLDTGARWEAVADEYRQAALAPDGNRVAVLADAPGGTDMPDLGDESVAVILIDRATGGRRLLWSADGYLEESSISWSPDGQLLAVTYLTIDDVLTTVVLDLSGTTIGVYPERVALPGAHSVWISDRELIVFPEPDDTSPLTALDVSTGRERRFDRRNFDGYLAISGGRQMRRGASAGQFVTANLDDDGDERPFLTFEPAMAIKALDIVPGPADS
jgi:dipeptidyl aminopeptidase/acylaminoacyl peptidase